MAGFHDQMSYTPPAKKIEKEETFQDLIDSLVNVFITKNKKQNYIAVLTRNNAKGVIMAESKNAFLKQRFGLFKHDVIDAEGNKTGYSYDYFDRTISEGLIESVLSTYPAVSGKRAELIADMIKNATHDMTQQSIANKFLGTLGSGNNMFRR